MAMLIAAGPIIALCGVAIKMLNGGPVFFSQQREGLNGRAIVVRKLRTMHRDADRRLREYLQANSELRREWEQHMKISCDPRVIPLVGPFLRRFSLDELPQLLNVVRGEMSLVGPRPFPTYHLERFTPEFRRLRSGRDSPGCGRSW
jgi:lipopolysaccharide/colanic/teichoic acid biosynthesis glycosyltransferase